MEMRVGIGYGGGITFIIIKLNEYLFRMKNDLFKFNLLTKCKLLFISLI